MEYENVIFVLSANRGKAHRLIKNGGECCNAVLCRLADSLFVVVTGDVKIRKHFPQRPGTILVSEEFLNFDLGTCSRTVQRRQVKRVHATLICQARVKTKWFHESLASKYRLGFYRTTTLMKNSHQKAAAYSLHHIVFT